MTIRIALIGFGKIAREQHVPAIDADPNFNLVAVTTPGPWAQPGVACFPSAETLFSGMTGQLDAVAICTPPAPRYAIARAALEAGLDVLLEKPPTVTLGELHELEQLARQTRQTIYAGWHSQHAPGVASAAQALADKDMKTLDIRWHEDVRRWHPGQQWIWQPGGFGVFDPGINALAIATRILKQRLLVSEANLCIPENRQAPIAASIRFGNAMQADMDWRPTHQEQWTLCVQTADGTTVELRQGGSRLFLDGVEQELTGPSSYPSMYRRFAKLCQAREMDIDAEPLRIVADVLLTAKVTHVEAFD